MRRKQGAHSSSDVAYWKKGRLRVLKNSATLDVCVQTCEDASTFSE